MKIKKKDPLLGKLFVVSAPSGAGKTSLVTKLIEKLESSYSIERVVTYTCKEPRQNEIQGQDYYFISKEEFEDKIKADFFVEWSNTYGFYYGMPKDCLENLKAGKSLIAIVDYKGAENIKKYYQNSILVWIKPPNCQILKNRLELRACKTKESAQEIAKRLSLAKLELENLDIKSLFSYIVENDDFEQALSDFEKIVKAELAKN